jgi:hypothetical protein
MATVVKDPQGNSHQLTGRLETIVLALIENASEIVRPQNARIEFDCSGSKVSAAIRHQLEMQRPEA